MRDYSSRREDTTRAGTLVLRGKQYFYKNAKDAMVFILRELAKEDGSFLERCSLHPDAIGRKRKYIAKTTGELYPDRPDLREYHEELSGGWLVMTNLSNNRKRNIIQIAAEVAGLTLGKDLIVQL
ncbi:MAG: hypothetical protein LBV12_02800 [Puniceicoccales bacterium]|nr:hypothetical protein [Puniceicoccales bacterium]